MRGPAEVSQLSIIYLNLLASQFYCFTFINVEILKKFNLLNEDNEITKPPSINYDTGKMVFSTNDLFNFLETRFW